MLRQWIFLVLMTPFGCAAQVTGIFSVDKSVFAPGEPVFLNLTLSNQGEESQEVVTTDPYSFCSGYRIQISHQGSPHVNCNQGYVGSCMSGVTTLAPHSSMTERILLNYPNDSQGDLNPPVNLAGDYTVDAVRTIGFAPLSPDSNVLENPDHTEIHQVFDLRIDAGRKADPSTYGPFVQQLASTDDEVRRDAARTLATLAPPALEPLLLTFATSKDNVLKQFAPLALANLSSEASLSALAGMLISTEPGTYEFMSAAEYLGRTHDPKWLPALLEVADQHGPMYLSYAAQSGGETAIPALLARMKSIGSDDRGNVIYALGSTGSRTAIPLLIDLLKRSIPPNDQISLNDAANANAALQQLTHRYVERSQTGAWVDTVRQHWQRWWLTSGRDAKTYLPGECVPDIELP
jgi:HEAT repeats